LGDVLRDKELLSLALGELNVKAIKEVKDEEMVIKRAYIDGKKAGPRLRGAMKAVMEELKGMDPEEVYRALQEKGRIEVAGEVLTMDDFTVDEALPENLKLGEEGGVKVYLNTEIDEDLKREGLAKEVVRRIQVMRKEMDLPYDAKISVSLTGDEEILEAARSLRDYIMGETLSKSMGVGGEGGQYVKEWDVDGLRLKIGIERV